MENTAPVNPCLESVALPAELRGYVKYVVVVDPQDNFAYSMGIRYVCRSLGALELLKRLSDQRNRKHKKPLHARLCAASILCACPLGHECPEIHVTPEGYNERRLWNRPIKPSRLVRPADAASGGESEEPSEGTPVTAVAHSRDTQAASTPQVPAKNPRTLRSGDAPADLSATCHQPYALPSMPQLCTTQPTASLLTTASHIPPTVGTQPSFPLHARTDGQCYQSADSVRVATRLCSCCAPAAVPMQWCSPQWPYGYPAQYSVPSLPAITQPTPVQAQPVATAQQHLRAQLRPTPVQPPQATMHTQVPSPHAYSRLTLGNLVYPYAQYLANAPATCLNGTEFKPATAFSAAASTEMGYAIDARPDRLSTAEAKTNSSAPIVRGSLVSRNSTTDCRLQQHLPTTEYSEADKQVGKTATTPFAAKRSMETQTEEDSSSLVPPDDSNDIAKPKSREAPAVQEKTPKRVPVESVVRWADVSLDDEMDFSIPVFPPALSACRA